MFNVTVLKMKDIKKYFFGMLATIIVVILVSKYLPQATNKEKVVGKVLLENSMVECLGQTVTSMSSIDEEYQKIANEEEGIKEEDLLQGILKTQISSIQEMETIEEKTKEEENIAEETPVEQNENTQNVEVAQTGMATQVITNNPKL